MGPKKQGFMPRINCSQMKLPNFGSSSGDSSSKVVSKLKSAENAFYKKGAPKLQYSSKNFFLERFG
jgi:hypothetical protein